MMGIGVTVAPNAGDKMVRRLSGPGAIVGGLVYAMAGAIWGASNLGWFGWIPEQDPLGDSNFWLGIGFALVVWGFTVQHGTDISSRGALGTWTARASIAAPVFLLLSPVIQFAIFGTLITFAAILMFTLLVQRGRLLSRFDVALLCLATVASITWNTETGSAALLIIVGLVGSWISYQALLAGRWGARAAFS